MYVGQVGEGGGREKMELRVKSLNLKIFKSEGQL